MARLLPQRSVSELYDVGAVLGDGPLARTYAATERATGNHVVLKQVSLRGLPGWKPVELFEREVAVMRTLRHPGVPRLIDVFQAELEGQGLALVLVLERIPGESLLALIERGHRWEEAEARAFLEKLLATLEHLHRLSPPVIHRDIKPSNIIVRPGGQPVLIDFGAVREVATRAGHSSLTVVGTAGYMPPEQAMGAALAASDLFALGATMIHALTHCHPADLPRQGLQLVFADRLGCSESLTEILERLVEPDVRSRYPRASDVLADLARPAGPAALARRTTAAIETRAPRGPLVLPSAPRPLTSVAEDRAGAFATLRSLGVGAGVLIPGGFLALLTGSAVNPWITASLLAGVVAMVGRASYSATRARYRHLYRHGVAVEGRVQSVTRELMNGEPAADLQYSYDVGGVVLRGTLGVTGEVAAAVGIDEPILVIHDPQKPRDHIAIVTR